MTDTFRPHMEVVARHFLGEPNKSMSCATELRFGSHGSMSVDLDKGTWFDNEAKEGGGVLSLITRQTQLKNGAAVSYLSEKLGIVIADDRPVFTKAEPKRIVAAYDYVDEDGELLFQAVRYEPKAFMQRRPDASKPEGWNYSVKGVRQIPYHLIDLHNLEGRGTAFIVEGEKDADQLKAWGFVASCNAGGAGKWADGMSQHFAGLDVIIIPDNDEAGRNHAALVGEALQGYANTVCVLDLPDLPPKGDVSDWIAHGGTLGAFTALVDTKARPWAPAPPESRFGAVTWSQLDSVTIRQDWLVEDLFFGGDMILAFGASGSGKSFLAVDMALSIARGVPFLGKKTQKGGVLYQAGEGGKGLVKRLKAYRQTHDLWKEDVPFVLLPERVNLFSQDGEVEAFIEECQAWKSALPTPLALIVIDTFSTASEGADENKSADMSRMLSAGQKLQKITGAAVLWVHHKNASGERERGHTSLRANMDSALEITRDEETNLRTLRVLKVKDGEDGEKICFELQSVQIGTYDDGKPMTSCVVRPAQAEPAQTGHKRQALSPGQRNFLMALDAAIRSHGGIMPPLNRTPSNTYGVEWHAFQEIYRSIYGSTMDADAIRQAHKRDGDALIGKGLIDRDHPWIWITERADSWLK